MIKDVRINVVRPLKGNFVIWLKMWSQELAKRKEK
jgi:hypothetical protein